MCFFLSTHVHIHAHFIIILHIYLCVCEYLHERWVARTRANTRRIVARRRFLQKDTETRCETRMTWYNRIRYIILVHTLLNIYIYIYRAKRERNETIMKYTYNSIGHSCLYITRRKKIFFEILCKKKRHKILLFIILNVPQNEWIFFQMFFFTKLYKFYISHSVIFVL